MSNKSLGLLGEEYAAEYLMNLGFHILERNATSRWGELDIVAEKSRKIYFVEVKTRISTRQGNPYEAVSELKVRHLARTIQYYILVHHLQDRKMQLDVISIEMTSNKTVRTIKRYENIFITVI